MSALPATMMCVEIKTPGGPEALVPATRPVPPPKPGELLIKVAATAVNRPDIAQRAGLYPPPPGASDLPGLEAAGSVAAVGEGVSGWEIGDPVCALTPGGSYAEYCTAPAPQCLPIPAGFDMLHAAALPENYFTVWHNLFERGALTAGESVLIHGGASGIGTTAIQLAKAFGARVFTTVRTAQKAEAVTRLGADHAILYKDNDWAAEVKKLSGGVDVVLDMVAGDYLPKNLQLLKQDGRCVVIALQGGATATIRHHDGEPAHADRLDPAAAECGKQGPHGAGIEGEGLAAAREGHGQADHLQDVRLEGCRSGARRTGARRPCRQSDDDGLI
jgi:NADPH2:quinone reductase